MATILWFVLGLLVASFAKVVFWGDAPIGWAPVLAAGVVGGIGGGFLRGALWGTTNVSRFDSASLASVIVGATVLVYAYHRSISRKRLTTGRAVNIGQRPAA